MIRRQATHWVIWSYSRTPTSGWPQSWAAWPRTVGAAGPVCFLEGGYDPELMGRSIVATVRGLAGEAVGFAPGVTPLEHAAVVAALRVKAPNWGADLPSR